MIHQLRLKLPNHPGTLERAVRTLVDAGVDMKALEVNPRGGGDHGEAMLIVGDADKAAAALKAAGQACEKVPAVVVEVEDRVGGLLPLLKTLASNEVNILHLYAFVSRVAGKSLCVLGVSDPAQAERLVKAAGYTVLGPGGLDAPAPAAGGALGAHLGADFIW